MSEILASVVVGLGLFFLGLNLVGVNLKQVSGRQFRTLITRFTDQVWKGSLLGVLAGVCMQSTSAVTVVLASMTVSGLLTVRQALPIVAWTNVGTTLLVFVTLFDLHLVVLYLLGVSATVFAFAGEARWKPICGVVLGICLLFFGMNALKTGAARVQDYPWAQSVLAQAHGSYALALLAGALFSFVTQSATAVVFIAVTLVRAGLLGPEETMMIIYGGNVGSTFSRMVLSSGLKGSSRQVGRFQDLFKIVGSALFVLLFYVELYYGVPLVRAFCATLSPHVETQMAVTYLLCNLVVAVLLWPIFGPTQRLLNWCWPASEAEDFARLKYLHPQILDDPETALDLLEKEQMRLLTRLTEYFNALRPPIPGKRRTDTRSLHQSFLTLSNEVDWYFTRLIHLTQSSATSQRLSNIHDRQEVIRSLEDSINQLVAVVEQTPPSAQLALLVQNMTEALDFLMVTAGEAATTLDSEEADLLARLCAERGELLGRIRTLYLTSEHGLSPPDKSLLLNLTMLFDRIVWLVRRFAVLLQQNQRFRS
jgi:phosphate:Na+ symporter